MLQNFDATLRDTKKICCDSKWVCCDNLRPKHLRYFARHKTDMLRLPGSRFAVYVSTDSTQDVYVSTMFNRGRTFPPISTKEKRFDRVRPKSFSRRSRQDVRKTR